MIYWWSIILCILLKFNKRLTNTYNIIIIFDYKQKQIKTMKTLTKEKTIVKFQTGRGGRFNNPGHKTFVGCEGIAEGYTLENLFLNDTTKEYEDCNGNEVGLNEQEANGGIGCVNIDNQYDTTYTTYIDDCDSIELAAIIKYNPYNLVELIKEANVFNDENDIEVLYETGKLMEAVKGEYYNDPLFYIGVEEISKEEYEEEFGGFEVNGKYYR